MLGRIILVIVDTQTHGKVGTLGRSTDDDLLHRVTKMGGSLFAVCKQPCGFHNDLGTQITPGNTPGISLGKNPDLLSVQGNRVFVKIHISLENAVDRIVLQQMSQGFGVGNIVHRHKLHVGVRF